MTQRPRRKFLKQLFSFLAALFFLSFLNGHKKIFAKSKMTETDFVTEFFKDPKDLQSFAEAYLQKHLPDPQEQELFRDRFLKDFNLDLASSFDPVQIQAFRDEIIKRIQGDYQSQTILHVNHWLISETEAKFYAWSYLVLRV